MITHEKFVIELIFITNKEIFHLYFIKRYMNLSIDLDDR